MKIVLLGAGNLGYHLGKKLHEVGENVVQVFSRDISKASALATAIHAKATNDYKKVYPDAGLYLLAVHDSAIPQVVEQLTAAGVQKKLLAHTSGATPIHPVGSQQLANSNRFGVFYPLQTFSISRQPDFSQVPFCVDAENEADLESLKLLASRLSPLVYEVNDHQRSILHLGAVFVNNFSNHLFNIGKEMLAEEKIPFDLLLPLIRETVAKLEQCEPSSMQTGPAIRGDEATIQRHLERLAGKPEWQEVYRILTSSIQSPKSKT